MIKPTARRLGLLLVAVATVGLSISAPAHAEGGTGSIAGHLTKDGQPVANAQVGVHATDIEGWGSPIVTTDADGYYVVNDLPAAHFKVSFDAPGEPSQYAFQKTTWEDADVYAVTDGAQTTVDDALLPTGTISGRFLDRSGNGIPWAGVAFIAQDSGQTAGYVNTDADGNFAVHLHAGSYTVSFSYNGGNQYAVGTTDYRAATVYQLAVGQTVTINETMLPTGSVAGRFVDRDGNGMANVNVSVEGAGYYSATTDAGGYYRIENIYVGSYQVRFDSWEQNFGQYAYGQIDSSEADVVTVTDGGTTTVNDQLLPTGSVHVSVTDALTGAPISSFSLGVGQHYAEGADGSALVTDIPVGNEWYWVSAAGYLDSGQARIMVRAGETTELTITLTPAAKITVHVVSADTGQPVAGFCLLAAPATGGYMFGGGCRGTDENGNAELGGLSAGPYNVFAYRNPWDDQLSPYGAQWVGSSGGTGQQELATLISLAAGETEAAPTVRLDKAGSITGKVTGAAGTIGQTWVQFGNFHYHSGDGVLSFPVAADGRYTVAFLGPYKWPLHFMSKNYAPQWSGNAGSRTLAKLIKVKAGGTVSYDIQLKTGTTVAVSGGEQGWIVAYDAATGEVSGVCNSGSGSCDMHIVGAQAVKILVWANREWWSGGADFATAKSYTIPSSGTLSIALTH